MLRDRTCFRSQALLTRILSSASLAVVRILLSQSCQDITTQDFTSAKAENSITIEMVSKCKESLSDYHSNVTRLSGKAAIGR